MKIIHTLILLLFIVSTSCNTPEKRRLTILYTTDEHGWLSPSEKADGAAALLKAWKDRENFSLEADSFLVISGGDMWTGASISTWFSGRSMLEVMNALGYDAAALGNHEFDFSLDTLKVRAKEAAFPFLAANLTKKDATIPDFVKPYTMLKANGLSVGIIGLANVQTPNTSNPSITKDFQFTPYDSAINKYVPILQKKGADLVLIVGHICEAEMEALAPLAKKWNIPLITGGHCHREVLKMQNEVLLIESTPHLTSYIKVVLEHDSKTKNNRVVDYQSIKNRYAHEDETMAALIKKWEDRADADLNTPIAYTEKGIKLGTPAMKKLTTDSWLTAVNTADIAIVNAGGIRQDIEAGDITMGTILGLLPFNNQIVQMTFSGKQVNDFMARQSTMKETYIMAGLDRLDLQEDKSYKVLTTDFLYALEETQFKVADPAPYYLSMLYREPTIRWLRSINSSKERPLERFL